MVGSEKRIKFCKLLYSGKSIREATREFNLALGGQADFRISKEKGYVEVKITSANDLDNDFIDEFCNYVLYLNINQS